MKGAANLAATHNEHVPGPNTAVNTLEVVAMDQVPQGYKFKHAANGSAGKQQARHGLVTSNKYNHHRHQGGEGEALDQFGKVSRVGRILGVKIVRGITNDGETGV